MCVSIFQATNGLEARYLRFQIFGISYNLDRFLGRLPNLISNPRPYVFTMYLQVLYPIYSRVSKKKRLITEV